METISVRSQSRYAYRTPGVLHHPTLSYSHRHHPRPSAHCTPSPLRSVFAAKCTLSRFSTRPVHAISPLAATPVFEPVSTSVTFQQRRALSERITFLSTPYAVPSPQRSLSRRRRESCSSPSSSPGSVHEQEASSPALIVLQAHARPAHVTTASLLPSALARRQHPPASAYRHFVVAPPHSPRESMPLKPVPLACIGKLGFEHALLLFSN